MSLRYYLATMFLATTLCWLSWVYVLLNVDPFETSWVGYGFFFLSLFLASVGTWSILLFGLYYYWYRAAWPLFRYVQKSFRDAAWLALGGTALLWLQGAGYLTWVSGLTLAGVFILISAFTLSLKPRRDSNAAILS